MSGKYLRQKVIPYINGSPLTGPLPSHKSGDVILAVLTMRTAGQSWTETASTGWSKLTSYNTTGVTVEVWGKAATSSSETTPVFTASLGYYSIGCYLVLEGLDIADLVEATATPIYSASKRVQLPALTTATDGCMILYAGIYAKATPEYPALFDADVRQVSWHSGGYAAQVFAGIGVAPKAGTPTRGYIDGVGSDFGIVAIAFNTIGNAGTEGGVLLGSNPNEAVALGVGTTFAFGGPYCNAGTQDPSTMSFTVDGLTPQYGQTTSYAGNVILTDVLSTGAYAPAFNYGTYTWNSNIVVHASEFGSTHPMWNGASGIDISGKILSVRCTIPYGLVDWDDGGRFLGFVSGGIATGKISFYKLEALDTKVRSDKFTATFVFDTANIYESGTGGDIDLTDVTNIVPGIIQQGTQRAKWACVYALSPLPIIGGAPTTPAGFRSAYNYVYAHPSNTIQAQNGAAANQYYGSQSIQVGTGSTSNPVDWDSDGESFEFPAAYSVPDRSTHCNTNAGAFEFRIKLSDDCKMNMGAGVLDMGDAHRFIIDPVSSELATYNFSGRVLKNADVSLQYIGADKITNMTFDSFAAFALNDADLTGLNDGGNIFSNNTIAIVVTTQAQFENLRNATFIDSDIVIEIQGNFGGQTWDGSGMSVSGGIGSYDLEYTGTGTLTIVMDAGSGFSTPRSLASAGGGASLVIDSPTLALDITCNVPATIRYFPTGSQSPTDSKSGVQSNVYEYPNTSPIDIEVVAEDYIPVRFENVTPYNGTYPVELIKADIYDSAHGYAKTTDFTYNRTTKALALVGKKDGRKIYSALQDLIRTDPLYFNTDFDWVAIGPDRINFMEGATISNPDDWQGAGMEWYNSSGVRTHAWFYLTFVGSLPAGVTGEYQQTDGGTVVDLLNTGAAGQVVKYYEDADGNGTPELDVDTYFVLSYQPNGYHPIRIDLLASYGITNIEPYEYTLAGNAEAITDFTTGDPTLAAAPTITNHGATPVTWNSKQFSITITDSAAGNTGEKIFEWINYNLSLDAVFQGDDPFNQPRMIVRDGDKLATERGDFIATAGATLKGIRVVENDGTTPHAGFSKFMADDGTYYVPPISVIINMPNLVDGTRVRLFNEDTQLEIDNSVVSGGGGYSLGFIYTGDVNVSYTICCAVGATAYYPISDTGIITSAGMTVLSSQSLDDHHNTYGVDGLTIDSSTGGSITADGANIQIDINDANNIMDARDGIAWWRYITQTEQGIRDYNPLALTYNPDIYNIQVNGPLQIENTKPSALKITNGVWTRLDGGDLIASTSNTIHWVPDARVYSIETGVSGLTAGESNKLDSVANINSTIDVIYQDLGLKPGVPVTIDQAGGRTSTGVDVDATDNGDGTVTLTRQ